MSYSINKATFDSYHSARDICRKLGGELMMEADKNNSLIIGKTLLQHTSNPSKIDKEEYNWIPIKLEKYDLETGYQWLDDRPSSCGDAVMNPKWGTATCEAKDTRVSQRPWQRICACTADQSPTPPRP